MAFVMFYIVVATGMTLSFANVADAPSKSVERDSRFQMYLFVLLIVIAIYLAYIGRV